MWIRVCAFHIVSLENSKKDYNDEKESGKYNFSENIVFSI